MRCQCLERVCIQDVLFILGRRKTVLVIRRSCSAHFLRSKKSLLLHFPTPSGHITPSGPITQICKPQHTKLHNNTYRSMQSYTITLSRNIQSYTITLSRNIQSFIIKLTRKVQSYKIKLTRNMHSYKMTLSHNFQSCTFTLSRNLQSYTRTLS